MRPRVGKYYNTCSQTVTLGDSQYKSRFWKRMSVKSKLSNFQLKRNLNILNIQYSPRSSYFIIINVTDLITLHPGPLLQPGQHHDGGAPLLPHQAPEVGQRLREWTLEMEKLEFKKILLQSLSLVNLDKLSHLETSASIEFQESNCKASFPL